MRSSFGFAFVLTTALSACNGGGTPGGGDDGGDPLPPDAAVVDPPARGFQIISKDATIAPGEEVTLCYYFRTPNTEPMVIKKWSSVMTPGSHHMIMYTTTSEVMPAGTLSPSECGVGTASASNIPIWQYAAQNPISEVALPSDDGTGKPLGQDIAANQPGYFQMHYLNASDAPITVNVTLNAEAYEAGTPYTKTAPYITYNSNISIPPGATNDVEAQTCNVPTGSKFWLMSTHAHKQAVKTEVLNGMPTSTDVAFASDNWEHPGTQAWMTTPFYSFSSNKLTYKCTYNNTGDNVNRTITSGDSAATDEMCMATGYYFPATKPLICLNSLGPF